MERYLAIDNVCAWPNLTLLPNGEVAAIIFNQPSHGRWEGDVECWVSADEGRRWERRGVVAAHEPGSVRLNVAAGLAHDGALVAIVWGIAPKPPPPAPGQEQPLTYALPRPQSFPGTLGSMVIPPPPPEKRPDISQILDNLVCRSTDGGRSWTRTASFALPDGVSWLVPFGDIERSPDGTLAVTSYWEDRDGKAALYLSRSRDDGQSWGDSVLMGADNYNETDLLCLDARRWLAAARTTQDQHLELLVSEDGGYHWSPSGPLTLPYQHPGHLLRLSDGRILLTYGIRNHGQYAVGARLSADAGRSWGPPLILVDLDDATDGGYPSSVQLADGTIISAYYTNRIRAHRRYHMGVVRWQADS
ncbi:MAG: hypothetical protein EXR62_03395 [Chloroflexi bacterium]|nr:hypothetical protein [Chloroflexota bacterium]